MRLSNALQIICAAGLTAGIFTVSGCSTPPSPGELANQYRQGRLALQETRDAMLASCNAQFPQGSAERTSCINTAHEWYGTWMDVATQAYTDALNGHWNDARKRRKELEKELLEMLPNFDGLKEIFDKLNLQGSMTGSSSGLFRYAFIPGELTSIPGEPINIGDPIPIETETYDFNGSLVFDRNGQPEPATVTGTLDLYITQNGLQSNGKIVSGSLVAEFGNGQFATMSVAKNAGNTFSTNAAGSGEMAFLVTLDHSIDEWDAILFDTNWITLDLTIDQSGQMTLSTQPPSPHTPMSHSDYNDDGVLDYNTDFGAFLVEYAANADRADINADGVWNQEDIELWIGDFTYDEEQL